MNSTRLRCLICQVEREQLLGTLLLIAEAVQYHGDIGSNEWTFILRTSNCLGTIIAEFFTYFALRTPCFASRIDA